MLSARLDRRRFLATATAALAGFLLPRGLRAETKGRLSEVVARAAEQSPLVYISPLLTDGTESACHGEVWFIKDGDDLLVVTAPERWRAACLERGLDRARIWVGDYGVSTKSEGKFREGPTLTATARLERDRVAHARALAMFGAKYASEWSRWGPRFSDGLASGERVMIRYTPA